MDLRELFAKFDFDLLPNNWIKKVWSDGFAQAQDLPIEYESHLIEIHVKDLLTCASQAIKNWLLEGSNTSTRTWQKLIENGIKHRALLCLLSVLIQKGKTDMENEETRQLCLKATSLYFVLLAVPGSHVFHIFHSMIYANAMESFQYLSVLKLDNSKAKANKSGKKKHREMEESGENEEFCNDDVELLKKDEQTLIETVSSLLNDLIFLFKRFNLKEHEDSLIITIQILVFITQLERNNSTVVSDFPSENTVSSLAQKAYEALQMLYVKDHGDVQNTVKLTVIELFPAIVITDKPDLKLTAKEATVIKDHSVSFIHNILMTVGEPAYDPVRALIQQLCLQTPDRAELRAKSVQVIVEILEHVPYILYSRSVIWIFSLCFSDEVQHRITGLEIIYKIIMLNERTDESPLTPSNITNKGHRVQVLDLSKKRYLLGLLFSRCKDISAAVRAKVLTILGNVISSKNECIKKEIEGIFVSPSTVNNENGFYNFHDFIKNKEYESKVDFYPLPGAKCVINFLRRCALHKKVLVRKSALQLLSNIFLLNVKWITEHNLQLMVDCCRDISVSVRKLMVQCLTDLVVCYPRHRRLCYHWVIGVVPLLADQEIKCQDKVIEVLQTTIIDNLVPYKRMLTPLHSLPWTLLSIISQENMQKEFSFACHKWTQTNYIKNNIIVLIKSHVGTENNISAWYLLYSLSQYMDIANPDFILEYFYQNVYKKMEIDEYCFQLVTGTLLLNWNQLPKKEQKKLLEDLSDALRELQVSLPLIANYIDICQLIIESNATSPEEARTEVKNWAGLLIEVAERKLTQRISPDSCPKLDSDSRLCQMIYTLGDASQLFPDRCNQETLIFIENLLKPPEEGARRWKGTVSSCAKAVAVLTLGKFCLQDENTAKVMVPLFGQLLKSVSRPEIKINAMIALTDLCIRFTSVVENQISDMCCCLGDKNVLVRQKTLTLLIQLIQEDYLKLRVPLLFHFLIMLNDDTVSIRDQLKAFIVYSVLAKHKNIITQHFVECIFHYNGYEHHPKFSNAKMTDQEKKIFSLSGPRNVEKRRRIYKFMLQHMEDDHRFKVFHRVCVDILDGVTNGTVILDESGKSVLKDAFHILSCPDIKLSNLTTTSNEEEEGGVEKSEEERERQRLGNFARKTLISQVVKTNVMENIVPIIIKLKHKLAKMKSNLLVDLRVCLRELMKDYKNEVNTILAADEELAAEIKWDLQRCPEIEEEDDPECPQYDDIMKRAVIETVMNSKQFKGTKVEEFLSRSLRQTNLGLENCSPHSSLRLDFNGSPQPSTSRFSDPQPGMSKSFREQEECDQFVDPVDTDCTNDSKRVESTSTKSQKPRKKTSRRKSRR